MWVAVVLADDANLRTSSGTTRRSALADQAKGALPAKKPRRYLAVPTGLQQIVCYLVAKRSGTATVEVRKQPFGASAPHDVLPKVETICVHDLGPCCSEVVNKLGSTIA